MNIREKYEKALSDELVDILIISKRNKEAIEGLLEHHPNNFYVSEWRYGIGRIKYIYHMHDEHFGQEIKNAYHAGYRAGHPHLTAVYSRQDLIDLIESKTGAGQDNLQI